MANAAGCLSHVAEAVSRVVGSSRNRRKLLGDSSRVVPTGPADDVQAAVELRPTDGRSTGAAVFTAAADPGAATASSAAVSARQLSVSPPARRRSSAVPAAVPAVLWATAIPATGHGTDSSAPAARTTPTAVRFENPKPTAAVSNWPTTPIRPPDSVPIQSSKSPGRAFRSDPTVHSPQSRIALPARIRGSPK